MAKRASSNKKAAAAKKAQPAKKAAAAKRVQPAKKAAAAKRVQPAKKATTAKRSVRHQDYVDYYEARAARAEGRRRLYTNSAKVERALARAMAAAPDIESFDPGSLPLDNAKALVRDQETARAKLFDELDEPVRGSAPKAILAAIDGVDTVEKLNSMAGRARKEGGDAENLDRFGPVAFVSDLPLLENVEVWSTAPVPPRWRAQLDGWASDAVARGATVWSSEVVPAGRQQDPAWTFDEVAVWQTRHRRLIPFSDAVLRKRLEQHRRVRGG